MFRRKSGDEVKAFQRLNPNQRQYVEDQKRYREKLNILHGGKYFEMFCQIEALSESLVWWFIFRK